MTHNQKFHFVPKRNAAAAGYRGNRGLRQDICACDGRETFGMFRRIVMENYSITSRNKRVRDGCLNSEGREEEVSDGAAAPANDAISSPQPHQSGE